jgi:hypothetical protein
MHHVSAVLLANETHTRASTGYLLLCCSIYGAFVTSMKGLSYHCDNQPHFACFPPEPDGAFIVVIFRCHAKAR